MLRHGNTFVVAGETSGHLGAQGGSEEVVLALALARHEVKVEVEVEVEVLELVEVDLEQLAEPGADLEVGVDVAPAHPLPAHAH